ncbi:MAG: TetR family transcriptional regulator [Gammaproteobacteria bacterium]|jgi:TetR/AcrR family acrAB operon transcriptional repressor|nr:TetR family transcriptional regulator [Gammaproteobacteria bacterium]
MARKTKAEAEATREALLDAAEAVFFEKGVARATLRDIAHRAGVTRGALYWHFKGKAELFQAMLDRVYMPFEDLVEAIPREQRGGGALEDLRLACIQGLQRMERPQFKRVHNILFHRCEAFADINPVGMLKRLSDDSMRSTLSRFEQAESDGLLRDGLDAETANIMMHATLRGLIHTWHLDTTEFSLSETGSKVVDEWFRLIACDPAVSR